jgi:ribosomal protein L1
VPHVTTLFVITTWSTHVPVPVLQMGTLTDDITGAIAELRQGRVEFKMDRTGIVHAPIGKASFDPHSLYLNLGALTGQHSTPAVHQQCISSTSAALQHRAVMPGMLLDEHGGPQHLY